MKNAVLRGLTISLILLFVFSVSGPLQGGENPAPQTKKININTASHAELQKLPQVGEKIAQRIIDFRTKNGNFKRIEEIMKVKGIGEKTFLRLKPLITIGKSSQSRK